MLELEIFLRHISTVLPLLTSAQEQLNTELVVTFLRSHECCWLPKDLSFIALKSLMIFINLDCWFELFNQEF